MTTSSTPSPLFPEDKVYLPEEALSDLGWSVGDALELGRDESGTLVIRPAAKLSPSEDLTPPKPAPSPSEANAELPIFLVETVSSHRILYAVQAKSLEHAFDAVTCEEVPEMDQNHLGEQIFSGRQVSFDEVAQLLPACWSEEIQRRAIHVIDYTSKS